MKIKVPVTAIDKGLTDREMVFVSMITQLLYHGDTLAHKIALDTEFYVYISDIRRICARHSADIHGPAFEKLREVLNFKDVGSDKMGVTIKEPKLNKRGIGYNSMQLADFELTNQKAIYLYFYLIGITSVKDVVQEFKSINKMPKNLGVAMNRLVKVYTQ